MGSSSSGTDKWSNPSSIQNQILGSKYKNDKTIKKDFFGKQLSKILPAINKLIRKIYGEIL